VGGDAFGATRGATVTGRLIGTNFPEQLGPDAHPASSIIRHIVPRTLMSASAKS
jgi:hypothetical protein